MAKPNRIGFREWCREKWFQYREECEAYMQQPVLDADHYFKVYKYWLKREYKHELGVNHE
jgi:hypothetical protein